jgi:hypothetical protein
MHKPTSFSAQLSLLVIFWLLPIGCNPQASSQTISGLEMAAVNQLYEDGNFAEAALRYQALVDAGVEDGRLYYNLGNTYFKMNDLGRAVLNFRRAQRLLPRDGDVVANLRLARDQTLDRIESENKGATVDLFRNLIYSTTLDEAAVAALVLWVVLCGLGVGAILWQQWRRILLMLASGITLLLFSVLLSVAIRSWDERGQPPAVVVADEVAVHSGPGDGYLTEFTLHAGAEVRVVERWGGWLRVTLPGDLQGWTPGHSVIEVSTKNRSSP